MPARSVKGKRGGSGIICRSRETAGGHRPRGGRICAPEKERAELHRAVPLSFGKDAVVRGASGKADLSLLRLRRGRGRIQVRDGDGQVRLHGGGAGGGGQMRHRHSATAGPFAGGAARTATAHCAGGIASRGGGVFCAATREHTGGQSGAGIPRGSRPGRRGDRALRIGLRAFGRRRAAAASEGKISGEADRSVGPGGARCQRARLRPLPPAHHVPHRQRIGQSDGVRRASAGRRPAEVFEFARDADLYQEHRALSPGSRQRSHTAGGRGDSGGGLHGYDRGGAGGDRERGGELRHQPDGDAGEAAAAGSRGV